MSEGDRRRGRGDGRFIDPRLGTLSAEGSGQVVDPDAGTPGAWRPRSPVERDETPSYHDRPLLKEPVWIWSIPAYFYAGGTAAAAAALAAAAQAVDRRGLAGLVRRARVVAGLCGGLGTVFLVVDLGRPERFLNMLRVFRPSSPMSVGSWIVAAATSNTALAALLSGVERGGLRRVGDAAGLSAAVFGLGLAAYPGVLLAHTAVPIWVALSRPLPPLFVASAVSAAASLLDFLPASRREERVLHAFGLAGKAAVIAGMVAAERAADRVERVGRPLREGLSGALWRGARLATIGGFALSLLATRGRRRRRALRFAAAAAGTAGALALRWAVVRAGHSSVRDPRAAFAQQRRDGAPGQP